MIKLKDCNWSRRSKRLSYLKNCFKIIATDLSKQQELDADPKANQQINFTGNLNRNVNAIIIIEKAKKRFWIFHKELWKYCKFVWLKMTQYNTLNVKWFNLPLNKLKPVIKIGGTHVTLNLSWNVVGDYNDEANFPHKLSLINT